MIFPIRVAICFVGGLKKMFKRLIANSCRIKLKYLHYSRIVNMIKHCLNELIDLNRSYDTIIKSHSKNNDQRVHRIPNWGNKSID